jgi:hypothetical protein
VKVLPAEGGGRWVFVPPERLDGWLARFADRHGSVTVAPAPDAVLVTASDGAVAECAVPFPPMVVSEGLPYGGLGAHALVDRQVGVLLVRLGGHAAGVFDGPRLTVSKVGSRQVHGRSAAGGWSQQRFARRREGQVPVLVGAAIEVAARVLLPAGPGDALVTGGDRALLEDVLADPRLRTLRDLRPGPHLEIGDPRSDLLKELSEQARSIRIELDER